MKTLLTILFIGVISVRGQVFSGPLIKSIPLDSSRIYHDSKSKTVWYIDENGFVGNMTLINSSHQCECCSEWFKQIGRLEVLAHSYGDLILFYYKDSSTLVAIKDHVKELQREIDELLKKAIDCR